MLNSCNLCNHEGIIVMAIETNTHGDKTKMYHGECMHCHAITSREYTEQQAENAWNFGISLMKVHEQIKNGIYSWHVQKTIDKLYDIIVKQKDASGFGNYVRTVDMLFIGALCEHQFEHVFSKWCTGWSLDDFLIVSRKANDKFFANHVKDSEIMNKAQVQL